MTTNFIKDNQALPAEKQNFQAASSVPADRKVDASDWNGFRQALLDIQSYLRNDVVLNAKNFGAVSGGDCTTALQAALDAAKVVAGGGVSSQGATVFVPAGTYLISSALNLPYNISVTLDPHATIRATGAMTAMLYQADTTSYMRENLIEGGVWDANSLATDVFWFRNARGVRVQNTTLMNILGKGLHFGDFAGTGLTSYGLYTDNVAIWRATGAIPAGSVGIFLDTGCGDSMIRTAQIVGVETGIKFSSQSSNNRVLGAHVWSFASTGSTVTAFEDNGLGNIWVGAYADTPSQYGFKLSSQNAILLGCKVYVNSIYGVDNTVVGVKFTQTNPTVPFATLVGCHFIGADGSHRLAKDIDAWSTTGLNVSGTQLTSVVTSLTSNLLSSLQSTFITSTDDFTASKKVILNAAAGTSNRRVDVRSSGSMRWSMGGDSGAEAGANAGTGFVLNAYDDSGTLLRTDLFIQRSNGRWSIAGEVDHNGGLKIGASGTLLTQAVIYTPNLTPAAVAANTTAEQTFTVTGVTTADTVHINPPASMPNGLGIVGVRVSAADTVAIRFSNNTAGSLTPIAGVYRIGAIRS